MILPDDLSFATIGIVFVATFAVTFAATPFVGKLMRKRGVVGKDVHKRSKPKIPEMCGVAIVIGLMCGTLAYWILNPRDISEAVAFIFTVLIAGGIGFVDDLRPLGPRLKPVLTSVASLPILLLGTYSPFPAIPLFGPARLTIVYPVLIPVAIAVTSNAVNMMDVANGSMAGTVAIISAAVTAVLLVSGNTKIAAFSAGLLAAALAFYYFNRFPARVFSGDTGSLAVGAALGALAILGRIETIMVVALIPHIMNAFYGLASLGGLYERRQIHERPTRLREDGTLEASTQKTAPVTLARLILAPGPLEEMRIVRGMILLTAVSSLLALLTYSISQVGRI